MSVVPALCEDGSSPAGAANGSFECRGGSEPACENGAEPTQPAGSTTLLCPASSAGESSDAGEGECEEACTAAPAQCEGTAESGCEPSQPEESDA
ncbi:MAG TPA: hypothetical protein VII01_01245 [Solirubrobacteraceae bacterium]